MGLFDDQTSCSTDQPSINFDVDYVISYRASLKGTQQEALDNFSKLIQTLQRTGINTEVREGSDSTILVFLKAKERQLLNEVCRSRLKDWLFGIRSSAPEKSHRKFLSDTALSEAERLRNVYFLITRPLSENGAGVTPGKGEWQSVESIFPLHDPSFNKDLIKTWSTKSRLGLDDLTMINDQFGPKTAYYFAFLQCYFAFLIFPTGIGSIAWLFFGHCSPLYAIVNCLWSVIFIEYWKRREVDLSVTWEVRGVSAVKSRNADFKHEKMVEDPVTGETVAYFSPTKRICRQLLQIPFALIAASLLGALIALCFAIEVFIEEVYMGPLKSLLVYLPMTIITALMPLLQDPLSNIATRLVEFENYETVDAREGALVQKMFVLDFITSFLPAFLVAFVYVPFGTKIVPYLNFHGLVSVLVKMVGMESETIGHTNVEFSSDPDRLKYQIIYFAVSAQGMNLINEVILPFAKRKGLNSFKRYRSTHSNRSSIIRYNDAPEEMEFLNRVRQEAGLTDYDVNTDLREMCEQFGYLSLFSVVWPLTAVAFLIGNWVELRSDAYKIFYEKKRPIPWRVDTIGPWLDHLGFIAWLGSLSSAALVYLFHGGGVHSSNVVQTTGLLVTIFVSEHIYLFAQVIVRKLLGKIESPEMMTKRREKYLLRKRYVAENFEEGEPTAPEEIKTAGGVEELSNDAFWLQNKEADRAVKSGMLIIARGSLRSRRTRTQLQEF
ncbi:hypothetical protein BP5796_03589 [Coleophoma crateriformis]|uniref:DUF590-domain-containing protein n=1 Tax=Coleophoma crateriformis TaxID=565419 RepID=A0A3D8SNJ5_9HELO|nr:hypothetical protein BP5796_03589 [Coleophoma crateriformis]